MSALTYPFYHPAAKRPKLIEEGQLKALYFCKGIKDPFCIFYDILNEDTLKIIGQMVILDAAVQMLCEHDLSAFLSSEDYLYCNFVGVDQQLKEEMAKLTYHLYLGENEEQIPPLQARFIINVLGDDEEKYYSLPDIVWTMRSEQQALCDVYYSLTGEETETWDPLVPNHTFALRLHDACRLHTKEDHFGSSSFCCNQTYGGRDRQAMLQMGPHFPHLLSWSTEMHQLPKYLPSWTLLSVWEKVQDVFRHIIAAAGKEEERVRWLSELFLLQACLFPIGDDKNKINLDRSSILMDESEISNKTITGEFCHEYRGVRHDAERLTQNHQKEEVRSLCCFLCFCNFCC